MIRRGLPRPSVIPNQLNPSMSSPVGELIEKEMLSLIYSDGIDNPIDGVVFPDHLPAYKEYISL